MRFFSGLKIYLAIALAMGAVYALYANRGVVFYAIESAIPKGESAVEQGVIMQDMQVSDFKVVASGLEVPWDVVFLPDKDMLVTERRGRLLRIAPDGMVREISGVEDVKQTGEGGLLGIALHPAFLRNNLLYLYQTTGASGGTTNRVDRYRLDGDALVERTTILQNIPGAIYHDGGKIAFGPDGKLYVTTGDATQGALAQDLNSLAGKILRLNDDGTIPGDNPFGTAVWSYGHRNPQGLAWDGQNRLWATEHGRSGVRSGYDELNLIEPGKNYGWPTIEGPEAMEDMVTPYLQSGANDTWAPAGVMFFAGSLYFGGLRGESLYQVKLDESYPSVIGHFEKEFGRIRAVTLGPDRLFYITTSNRDGRGLAKQGDDKIIRVHPRLFQ